MPNKIRRTCQCHRKIPGVPFQVGDLVIYSGGNDPKGLVRRVTNVRPHDEPFQGASGGMVYSQVAVNGGPECRDCGKPIKCKKNLADAWLRKATKEEITQCERLYGSF